MVQEYVITLSSIPPRFDRLPETLRRLSAQTVPAKAIILYIPRSYTRFPDWDGKLPDVPATVEIRRTEQDQGPATKILPAMTDFAGQDVNILFCDDDMKYRPTWAAQFLNERNQRPDDCLVISGWNVSDETRDPGKAPHQPRAERSNSFFDLGYHLRWLLRDLRKRLLKHPHAFLGRCQFSQSGYVDILEGFGGVMVRPGFLPETAENLPARIRAVDDVWLSGLATARGHPVWAIAAARQPDAPRHPLGEDLASSVIEGATRIQADTEAIAYIQHTYGIWK